MSRLGSMALEAPLRTLPKAGVSPLRAGQPAARRRCISQLLVAAAGGALLLQAPLASAQVLDSEPPSSSVKRKGMTTYASPQHAAFEVRFGPYNPKVDDNLSTPVYADFFGDANRYMFGFELDWQAWRAPYIGTLGVGVGWGYTQMAGTNKVEFVPDGEAPPSVSQESSLNIMPIYGVGVLRIDTFARNFHVPLVPYGKFGLSWAFWWVNDGIGTATSDAGTKGRDISVGYQAAIGGMFLLDIIDAGAALAADLESGVNNSYIFFEWSLSDYGGDQMNVGSSNWVTGLAFEM